MNDSTHQKLWALLEPIIEQNGYELVELEYIRERGWVVRLYIDKMNPPVVQGIGVAPGRGISLDECSQISKQISALLDVEDVIPHAYNLEVSSPGMNRPIRKEQDFTKFLGCPVRIKTIDPIAAISTTIAGAKPSRNIKGILTEKKTDGILLNAQGQQYQIPFDKIARAHLDPDVDQWMELAKQARDDKGE